MKAKLKRAVNWYVHGYYHCDKCPYCWSEYSYEGDGDAGCYIFGDLRDTCRLIPPIRTIIGWPKKKKAEYYYVHEFDGFAEWNEQEEKRRDKFSELVCDFLDSYELCWKDEEGVYHPINKEDYVQYESWRLRSGYEEFCNPYVPKTLCQEWKDLIAKTWHKFIWKFKPYFCK